MCDVYVVYNLETLMQNRKLAMTLKFTKWPVLVHPICCYFVVPCMHYS